jgi:hypothetical protein
MKTFTPMLVFSGIYLFKIIMFKVNNTGTRAAMVISLVCMALTFESHFDANNKHVPLYLTGIPPSVILVAFFVERSINLHTEKDECLRIFNLYNSKFRMCLTHFELVATRVFCFISIIQLSRIELNRTDKSEEIMVIDTTLFIALLYLIATLRSTGQTVLHIVFYQF